jgi:tetratricopeptide (TPR) repeat protein
MNEWNPLDTNMQKQDQKPTLTFFHTDGCEWQTVSPIADEAKSRGFPVRFSTDLSERVQIGVYCQHACWPNADLSIIMLHDLAQRHDIWPAFWRHESWDAFDIGLVPGQAWVQRWQSQAGQPGCAPKRGVFNIGWPKADLIYRDEAAFRQKSLELRQKLGLKHPQTVLYAPSWENNGKQDDFVQKLKTLPVNLLLKQAPWPDAYPAVLENIRKMNALHEGMAENIHIVDPNVSIMYCIGIADLLVSEESSVLIEAALFGVPSLSVQDWLIPDRTPPRPACVPFENVCKTTSNALRQTVEDILADPTESHAEALRLRDHHFSHFGQSSRMAVDLIEAAWNAEELPSLPLEAPRDTIDLGRYHQAEQMLAAGNTAGAMAILGTLITQDSNCWQAFNDMAAICFEQGDTEGALSLLAKAVEKERTPGLAHLNCASVQRVAGKVDGALKNYAILLNSEPDNEQYRSALAETLAGTPAVSQDACEEMLRILCPTKRTSENP